MPSHSRSTATELLVRAARITIARWKAVSIALAGLGSIFSVSVLFTYLHVIGYPKLLGAAMTTKGALIPWIFITGLSFALYLAGLLVTSASYASALSFFKHNPQDQTAMSLLLMIPALTGIIALASSIIMMQRIGPIGAMAVAGGAVVATMLLMFLIPYFREKVCSNAVTDCEVHERSRLKQTLQIGVLTIAVWGTALTTVLPMLVLFSVYAWPANQHGILKLIATSVAITGVALFPAAAFFIGSDGVLTRARNALLGTLILVATALFLAPSAVPMIVYRAANLIGIQDLRVSSYMIRDTYAAKDFDSRWGSVETVRDYPVVEGFELFALGDIVLLCPKSLASTSFSDWPSKSHACLPLDAKSLKLMPDKQESDEASARPQPTSATK